MTDHDLDETAPRSGALRFRSPQLVIAIVGAVLDDPTPIPWTGIIAVFSEGSKYTAKTIENTLNDLCQLGAVQKIGAYRDRFHDTRAVRATRLGQAWAAGEYVPFPTISTDDE